MADNTNKMFADLLAKNDFKLGASLQGLNQPAQQPAQAQPSGHTVAAASNLNQTKENGLG